MCGQVNKKMSISDTVRVLTDACEQFRHDLQIITDQTEKQKLVLRHIKTFANTEACIKDFQKGLNTLILLLQCLPHSSMILWMDIRKMMRGTNR